MNRHQRSDVVNAAIDVLDRYGLADLTMRRLGDDLGVQPSALYHHFDNKQSLLAAVADELLERRFATFVTPTEWESAVVAIGSELRAALLACRDGADVVATTYAFGLGAERAAEAFGEVLGQTGLRDEVVAAAVDALVHFVFGHVQHEQTRALAVGFGAAIGDGRASDFSLGLGLIIAGIKAQPL